MRIDVKSRYQTPIICTYAHARIENTTLGISKPTHVTTVRDSPGASLKRTSPSATSKWPGMMLHLRRGVKPAGSALSPPPPPPPRDRASALLAVGMWVQNRVQHRQKAITRISQVRKPQRQRGFQAPTVCHRLGIVVNTCKDAWTLTDLQPLVWVDPE